MFPGVGVFEPTISVGKRPQTYSLYRAATGKGTQFYKIFNIIITNQTLLITSKSIDKTWAEHLMRMSNRILLKNIQH